MALSTILKKLKELFSFSTSFDRDYNWVCLDCGKLFDGNAPELFIKHQIDNKHYNVEKRKKL